MIQPNELRIGNFIYQSLTDMTESIYQIIRSIGEKYVSTNELNEVVLFNKLDGIPITHQILEKCGFEKMQEDIYRLIYNQSFLIGITLEKNNHNLFMIVEVGDKSGTFIPKRIKYLHQLQNLYFALTGEELIINI